MFSIDTNVLKDVREIVKDPDYIPREFKELCK